MVLPVDVLGTEYLIPAWQSVDHKGGSMIGKATTSSPMIIKYTYHIKSCSGVSFLYNADVIASAQRV